MLMRYFAALIPAAVWAQVAIVSLPRVDLIEFYGLHRVSPQLARQALGLSPGGMLPPSKADAEDRLLDIDRVIGARLEAVCCEGGKNILYVGIEERDAPRFQIRPAPGGAVELAGPLIAAFSNRGRQRPMLTKEDVEQLREVLRESGNETHRAFAAALLPEAPNKADIVEDLQEALTDNDAAVRANAVRSLTALALLERADPATKIRVSAAWFLDLLHSIAWSDRTGAARALEELTRDRDVFVLSRIRGEALDALIEMSRWQTEQHAYPAFMLVGRVAGLTDLTIRDAWLRAGRETVIGQALEAVK